MIARKTINFAEEIEERKRSRMSHQEELAKAMVLRPYKCMECGAQYKYKSQLARHSVNHSYYYCLHCEKTFKHTGSLARHMRKGH